MTQSGVFLTDISGLDNFANFPCKVLKSYSKELSNADTKKYKNNNNNIYIDTGLNMISKKIKKEISSITASEITLTNNEIS